MAQSDETLHPHRPSAAPAATSAEFDAYAAEYAGGMDNPVKRLVGGTQEAFIAIKARWLLDYFADDPPLSARATPGLDLLDFGCGTGDLLQQLRQGGFAGRLEGCDVSIGMLAELRRRWQSGALPELWVTSALAAELPPDAFDIIVACCVFHHVRLAERAPLLSALAGCLRPGGRLIVFEHNPRNPITRAVVARTPIDRGAVLLDPSGCRQLLAMAGLDVVRAEFLMFVPPRFRWAASTEWRLRHVPLGGQYVMVGERAPSGHPRAAI